jgi:hypothetical protein
MIEYKHVKAAFESNDEVMIRKANESLLKQLNVASDSAKTTDTLLAAVRDPGCTLTRNFEAETYVPIFCQKTREKMYSIKVII